MAITKIHAIKSTLGKALAYIENPDKTDGQMLVSGYNCEPQTASIDFEMTALNNIKKGPENLYRRVLLPFEGRVAIVRRVSGPLPLFKHFTGDAVPRAPPYLLILNKK